MPRARRLSNHSDVTDESVLHWSFGAHESPETFRFSPLLSRAFSDDICVLEIVSAVHNEENLLICQWK